MKAKWWLLLISGLILFVLSACEDKEVQPDEVFAKYIEQWNKQNFAEMYPMLSDSAKEIVSEEDFTSRYEKIYNDLGVSDLKVEFERPKELEVKDETSFTFPFTVSMNTIAGPIEFSHEAELVKVEAEEEETNWLINWDTEFIFEGLQPEDKIGIETVKSTRGEILDRNGKGLAINGEVNEVGLVPEKITNEKEAKEKLSTLLAMSVEEIDSKLNASWVQPNYFVPLKKFSKEDVELENKLLEIPGVQINTANARVYPLKEAAAHLIGYVGEVTAEDLEKNQGYVTGDVIGKRGLEQLLESRLKGENGVKITIEKPDGTTATLAEKPVKNGESVQLTIDSVLQQTMLNKYDGAAGTGVAINPTTGETLAIVSSPSFDPNQYVFGMGGEQQSKLEENPLQPLLNRFAYPQTPGSVMKPFTAIVGLETGTITPDLARDIKTKQWQKDDSWGGYKITRVTDPGKPVNLKDALVFSDNIYFAQTALEIGADKFIQGLKNFGFAEEIPYTYPLEPSKISNDGSLNEEILLADSGYGQGEVQTNIIQLASGYTAFINEGNMIKPTLLKEEPTSQVWKKEVVSKEYANLLAEDLRAVIAEPNGTGRLANMTEVPLAGKTGTAEIAKAAQGEQGTENGWFVAYNTDNKDLLIAMMMEGIQEHGSKIVVQKVKEIFQEMKS
ncbi:penicillin-binding transpeptidase domain-containing protein [Caldibacillus lycopersici]|uniref:serine-type D-Ala-D-Ala carboxypeptidase n=1 Tax=Perspicuibacillus lycopersici TaxID=1325689 RepID=A0AAE3IX68_9BACI|nr:penicillin-binding transpeptidase domain-containing protein [Perspicuibacillus lycopersici]MCU9615021.1 penicillin-binding transpeptidase domain-containing protein [Perspicuibacillus lycopersici]